MRSQREQLTHFCGVDVMALVFSATRGTSWLFEKKKE
jgi:hypothetical protein